jgi:hypothetical protein
MFCSTEKKGLIMQLNKNTTKYTLSISTKDFTAFQKEVLEKIIIETIIMNEIAIKQFKSENITNSELFYGVLRYIDSLSTEYIDESKVLPKEVQFAIPSDFTPYQANLLIDNGSYIFTFFVKRNRLQWAEAKRRFKKIENAKLEMLYDFLDEAGKECADVCDAIWDAMFDVKESTDEEV